MKIPIPFNTGTFRSQQVMAIGLYWFVIPACVLGPGLVLDAALGLPEMPWPEGRLFAGALLTLAGMAVIFAADTALRVTGGGTPSYRKPATKLVTKGVYSWCRHPMFFGYNVAAIGIILGLGTWFSLIVFFPVFVRLEVRFLRNREEPQLLRRFGEPYRSYQNDTPLLIPGYRKGRAH